MKNGDLVLQELIIYRPQHLPFPNSSHYSSISFLFSMEEDDQRELQLLPTPHYSIGASSSSSSSRNRFIMSPDCPGAALDLQLSISLRPIHSTPLDCESSSSVKALKWHASEQIRLATIEKAYAERVRELTRREMELAQSEFARARNMWERAREEVDKAERMKERAMRRRIDSTTSTSSSCMEITCQSCRQRFRPSS